MIFSRWRPDRGGYDYFDSPSTRYGLGDDLPVPILRNTTDIGVASTDIGRPMPIDAAPVGSGPMAKGMIAPMDASGLSFAGLGLDISSTPARLFFALAAACGLGFWVGKASKR